mgnify:CR=1 FL=1
MPVLGILDGIVQTFELATQTWFTTLFPIAQNLFFALAYNAAGVPVAAIAVADSFLPASRHWPWHRPIPGHGSW